MGVPITQTLPPHTTRRRRIRRVLGSITLVLLAGIGGLLVAGQVARWMTAASITAPGQLIDVGGHHLHLHCQGSATTGQPTIVLEAGLGESSLTWAGIQPALARQHRVCAYDRAGAGWSAPSASALGAEATVADLHTLLHTAGESGPYVLVGHSLGGIYARLFAVRYPGEVAGLVLLDPAHEEMVSRLPPDWQAYLRTAEATAAADLRVPALLADLGLTALFRLAPADPRLPATAQAQIRALGGASGQGLRTLAQELAANETRLAEVRVAQITNLGDLPLVVVKAGATAPRVPPTGLSHFTPDYDLYGELAAHSSRGRLLVVDDSTHYVHYDAPERVVDVITELVRQLKTASTDTSAYGTAATISAGERQSARLISSMPHGLNLSIPVPTKRN